MDQVEKPIVFFDGVCGLCNKSIDYILRTDRNHNLNVAPLQGTTASQLLDEDFRQDLDTIVLYENGKELTKSDAIFRIFQLAGSGWRWIRIFRFLPKGFRNAVYDLVANNRYRVFGKKDACRLPSPEERERFLD